MQIARTPPKLGTLALPVFKVVTNHRAFVVRKVFSRSNKGDSHVSPATTESRGTASSAQQPFAVVDDAILDSLLEYRSNLSYRRALGEELNLKESHYLERIDEMLEAHLPKDPGLSEQTLAAIDFVLGE